MSSNLNLGLTVAAADDYGGEDEDEMNSWDCDGNYFEQYCLLN